MAVNRTSSAAEYFEMVANNRRKDQENRGTDFAAMFAQMLGQASGTSQLLGDELVGDSIQKVPVPETTFSEYVRTPVTDATAWRAEEGYSQFRENYLNPNKIEYTDEHYNISSDGTRILNKEGQDRFNQWRIENLSPLAPDSIADAEAKFEAAYEHLNNYMHTMFKDNAIELDFTFVFQMGVNNEFNLHGMTRKGYQAESEENLQKFFDVMKTDQGKEMDVMAEEARFYGAIVELAEENAGFRQAYNTNSDAALDQYYNQIANKLDKIAMPSVQTIPNHYERRIASGLDALKQLAQLPI